MALSDFLTGGAQVPAGSAVKALSTSTTLPDWYTNYGMDVLANQQAIAAKPFQAYTDASGNPIQRFAGFTPDQEAAFKQTQQGVNVFRPELNTASQQTQNTFGRSGLNAAQPYLNQAGQTAAQTVGAYMNPYTEQVANRIGQLGLRTLNEQLLPGISDRMTAAGQFGGTRQAELMGRALRDTMEGISAQQTGALQQGYGQALGAAQTDLSRQATLGQLAGGLYNTDTSNMAANAAQMAALAQQRQNQELAGAGALNQIGTQQQQLGQQNLDFARAEWERQQADEQNKLNAMMGALQGVAGAVPKTVEEFGITPNAVPTTTTGQDIASGATAAAGLINALKKI
jgi:hypothetical protein